MGTNVSEDYRRGWVECSEAIRTGIVGTSGRIVGDFHVLRQHVDEMRDEARQRWAQAGDDPHQLRRVGDFYEEIIDLFLLRVEQERDLFVLRALHAVEEKASVVAS